VPVLVDTAESTVERSESTGFSTVVVGALSFELLSFGVLTVGVRTSGVLSFGGSSSGVLTSEVLGVESDSVGASGMVVVETSSVGPVGPEGSVRAAASVPQTQMATTKTVTAAQERVRVHCDITPENLPVALRKTAPTGFLPVA
jgi:hypothetical protein